MSDKTVVKLRKNMLVEYQGDFYTPEELADKLEATGRFEVILHDEDETWFGQALGDKQ